MGWICLSCELRVSEIHRSFSTDSYHMGHIRNNEMEYIACEINEK